MDFRIDGYEVSAKEFASSSTKKVIRTTSIFPAASILHYLLYESGEQTVNSSGENIVRFEPRRLC